MRHFPLAFLAVLVLVTLALPVVLYADITTVNAHGDASCWYGAGGGGESVLRVGSVGNTLCNTYLNFDITNAVPADHVLQSATLWLSVYSDTLGVGSISAQELVREWTGTSLTWAQQANYWEHKTAPLDTQSFSATPGQWVGWNVTGAWPGTGYLGVALVWEGGKQQPLLLQQ